MAQAYGYTGYYKPPRVSPPRALAYAASGKPTPTDSFGLLTDTTDSARVAQRNATPHAQGHTVVPASSVTPTDYGYGGIPGYGRTGATPPPTPTAGNSTTAYDVNTDPALQQVTALTGMSDEQAQAAALKQKYQELLGYGDPNLARSVLGDETLATAASKNPTSTLAQLGQQRDRNTHSLTDALNKENLLYSGYRVTQEQQAGQDYQNALAQAAAGVNSALGGIDSNLASALGQSQAERIAALQAAYGRHATDPGAATTETPPPPTSDQPPGPTDPPPPDANLHLNPDDYQTLLGLAAAAAGRRKIGA